MPTTVRTATRGQITRDQQGRSACCSKPRASRKALRVRAVASEAKAAQMAPATEPAAIIEEIHDKLKYKLGKVKAADSHDIYQSSAWSAREHLIDAFEKTHEYWK